MSLQIGSKAPNFSLPDTDKNTVTLESLKGQNVVLFFFPFAFTGVCTKEMCSVRDDWSFYTNIKAKVFGISVDSLFTLGKFKELNNVPFQLLSDFNKEACTAYDNLVPEWGTNGYKGVARRSTFLIDKEGVLRYMEQLPTPGDFPNLERLKEELTKLETAVA